jgi:hypothetical protein
MALFFVLDKEIFRHNEDGEKVEVVDHPFPVPSDYQPSVFRFLYVLDIKQMLQQQPVIFLRYVFEAFQAEYVLRKPLRRRSRDADKVVIVW